MRAERKVIQISTMCHAGSDQSSPYYGTVALCDDGTMWDGMLHNGVFSWTQLPPIPQPAARERREEGGK